MGGIVGPENLEGSNRKKDLSAIGPHRQSRASTVALPHSQQHTLSCTHTSPLPLLFPALSHTLSLFASVSLSHSFFGALLFHLSTVECMERWFGSLADWLAGWLCLDWGKQRQSWGPEGQDSTVQGEIPAEKIQRKISSSGDYLHHKTCGKRTLTLYWLHNRCPRKRCHLVC